MQDDSLKNPVKERDEVEERNEGKKEGTKGRRRERREEERKIERIKCKKKFMSGRIILPKNEEPFHSKSEIFPELEMS